MINIIKKFSFLFLLFFSVLIASGQSVVRVIKIPQVGEDGRTYQVAISPQKDHILIFDENDNITSVNIYDLLSAEYDLVFTNIYEHIDVIYEYIDNINVVIDEQTSTTRDILVGNVVGNYNIGDTIESGSSLTDVLIAMLEKVIPPIYVQPTLSINITPTHGNYEAGTSIQTTITPSWNQNDSGEAIEYRIYRNSIEIFDSAGVPLVYTDDPLVLGDGNISYFMRVWYEEGPTKNDNFGDPDPTGKILAGDIQSNTRTYVGRRRLWWDADQISETDPSSNDIRALGNTQLNPQNGTTFTLNIPVGSTRVIFAYPKNLREVSSVIYSLLNVDVKDTFTEIEVSVEGVNGFDSIPYRVYIYTPTIPFGDSVTYVVTI